MFARAREKARQTSCLSNVKQISLAAQMYTQDYDERYVFWALGAPTYWWAQGVEPYVKNGQLFACPSADGDQWRTCGCGSPQAVRPVHYGVNCGAGGQGGTQMPNWHGPLGQKLSSIEAPSETVWVGDSTCVNLGPNNYYPSQGTTCPGVAGRHNEGANLGFCDGHAKWMKWVNTSTSVPWGYWTRRAGD
ncbi:MAG: DUF1559 domain-containing protein [Armatimonadetes bacterium]|nr:DUF1559 domain-containing protein [Armatimonadota bacterium]